MPAPADHLISEEDERALHRRLLDREVTAFADLARLFLNDLTDWLVRSNSCSVPEDLCEEAAADALVALVKSPASFDPERGKRMSAYLRMSAQGDLRNTLQRQAHRHAKEIPLEDVELSPQAGKYLGTDEDPLLTLEIREEYEKADKTIVAPARQGLSEAHSRALDLLLQGEKKTAIFADALGLKHLPPEVQQDEVNRVKNMLKKRIKRKKKGGDGKPA